MKQQKMLNTNKGITLIALVITIIVMLILVVVTITMAVNGGLFEYASNAGAETNAAIANEQALGSGKVNVDGKWYSNIDDYIEGKELIELPEGIKVGDYVNYIPDKGSYTLAAGSAGSGYREVQVFTTEEDDEATDENEALEWRILSINEETGTIEIVSETVSSKNRLLLGSANGYNHGVDILNDLCEELYSKSVSGKIVAKGRSIKVEDINAKTTFDYTNDSYSYTAWGDTKSLSEYSVGARKYPNIYEREAGCILDEVVQTGLKASEGLYDGEMNGNGEMEYKTVIGYTDDYDSTNGIAKKNIGITSYFYWYDIANYLNLDLGINTASGELLNGYYWLASRAVTLQVNSANFGLFIVKGDWVNYSSLYMSTEIDKGDNSGGKQWGVRPVVEINSSAVLTIDEEKTTESSTCWDIVF